jgi:hypothetical protein
VRASVCSTKQGAREVFKACNIPFPVGIACRDFESEEQVTDALIYLIMANQNVKNWILKIEGEFQSRGIAIMTINTQKILKDI